jgi:hypothetical protein
MEKVRKMKKKIQPPTERVCVWWCVWCVWLILGGHNILILTELVAGWTKYGPMEEPELGFQIG